MSKTTNFMIHADVLAQSPKAAILGYGIVAFDPTAKPDSNVSNGLEKAIRVRSMTGKFGATVDPDTVLQLPKDQLAHWQKGLERFDGGVDFEPALFAFSGFISDHRTNDSLFYFTDMSVYAAINGAYDLLGYRHQWSVENSRDLFSQLALNLWANDETPRGNPKGYNPIVAATRNAQIIRRILQGQKKAVAKPKPVYDDNGGI